MILESLNSSKFKPLDREQMATVRGGADTPGGSKVIGTYSRPFPVQQDANGKITTTWVYRDVTMIRSWSSDATSGNETCYWGEETCYK